MTTGVVVFNPTVFQARFPMFSTTSTDVLQSYFDEATLLLNNTACSPVRDVGQRAVLLNLLVAHLGTLYTPDPSGTGALASTLVGRISTATEGSVSVGTDNGPTSASAAWYQQTTFGSEFWALTAPLRTMRYAPGSSTPGYPPYGFLIGPGYPSWPR